MQLKQFVPLNRFIVPGMSRGRPKIDINTEDFVQKWRSGKTKTEIAEDYGISRETLRRILIEKGIDVFTRQALTDEEIDQETLNIKCLLPNAGERLIIGHFRSKG